MKTITVLDPVTRIEGHMKIEIEIDTVGGAKEIVDARCTGTLFRGFEQLLTGKVPLDAPLITQRICGVCPISHAMASVLALENVSEWKPNRNARILRNLTLGSNFIASHILHFYLLAALDYVSGPNAAPWSPGWQVDMRSGPGLANVSAHIADAVVARRRAHEMGSIFGGKMPASGSYLPGGFTAVPTSQNIDSFRAILTELLDFIQNVYISDVENLSSVYSDYLNIGSGCKNLVSYGVFHTDDQQMTHLLKGGYSINGNPEFVNGFYEKDITESVKYSWYNDQTEGLPLKNGATEPAFPKGDAYSWIKAPRLRGRPLEAGSLARMWINGDYTRGISVMDRNLARAYEALKIANAMMSWLDELLPGQTAFYSSYSQHSGFGIGLTEAPRGALGHWAEITNGRISKYQVLTPTCWNASPKDNNDQHGPMEQALIGTQIEDPNFPIEALRIVHSYDPCLSCAVHVLKPSGHVEVISG